MTGQFSAKAARRALVVCSLALAGTAAGGLLTLPVRAADAANAPAAAAPAAPAAPLKYYVPPAGQDISGTYWIKSYSPKLQPIDGGDPPYKPEAMALYKKRQAAIAASATIIPEDQARKLCTPDGVPRILQSPYPFEIIQSQGQVHILYELNKVIRVIKMDAPMPAEKELITFPYYSGHSVAHWEGDTLVVETGGFKDYTFLDNSGAPQSDQLRVTERYRKINGGKELEVVVTLHDPGVFTRDWQTRYVYDARPDIRIMDWNCGEPHRNIAGVPGVQVPD
jgi:hypothetical protein